MLSSWNCSLYSKKLGFADVVDLVDIVDIVEVTDITHISFTTLDNNLGCGYPDQR